jgi:hypothetical protein
MMNKKTCIGQFAGRDTYAIKLGVNEWQIVYWSYKTKAWTFGCRLVPYNIACYAVRNAQKLLKMEA